MAETLQKVFMVFVRPAIIAFNAPTQIKKTGLMVTDGTYVENGEVFNRYVSVSTNNPSTCPVTSEGSINSSKAYRSDAWFLHSTYTSYEQFKSSLREIMNVYAVGDIKCAIYLPTDFEVVPFE